MRFIRALVLGSLAAIAVWLLGKPQGERRRAVQGLIGRTRDVVATALDQWGLALEGRAHAWSARLRPNGQSRKIPVEGRD